MVDEGATIGSRRGRKISRGSPAIGERLQAIIQALQVVAHSPLIGRPVKGGKRELVIGRGARGYVALYRFVADIDTVFVLALRSQREAGFKHPG